MVWLIQYIFKFYLKLFFCILAAIFLLYAFIAKETAYYYCNNSCITIIAHQKGNGLFFRVYDGIMLSKYSYLFFSYAEYPSETYIYIKKEKINGKIVVENFTKPIQYKGILDNVDFYISSYDSDEIGYMDLRYLHLIF